MDFQELLEQADYNAAVSQTDGKKVSHFNLYIFMEFLVCNKIIIGCIYDLCRFWTRAIFVTHI